MSLASIEASISAFATRVKNFVAGEVDEAEEKLTELEQKLLPGFLALLKKIESTIGSQGVTILEQGLADIVTVVENGGSIAPTVAALVPQVTAQVTADLKQDANTAAHGAIDLLVAAATASTAAPAAPSPAPAPAPAPSPAAA